MVLRSAAGETRSSRSPTARLVAKDSGEVVRLAVADALGRQTGWRSFKRESGGYWSSSTLPCQMGVPIRRPHRTIVDAFPPASP